MLCSFKNFMKLCNLLHYATVSVLYFLGGDFNYLGINLIDCVTNIPAEIFLSVETSLTLVNLPHSIKFY